MYLFNWRTTSAVLQIPMCFCISLADFFALAADVYFLFFKTCLFQSPKVASTLTAFRNTAKAVPNYSMSCSHSSWKVNSHRDPNPMLLPIYIVLLGSELINKLCNPEKPVSLVLVTTATFFLRKQILTALYSFQLWHYLPTSNPAEETYKCSSTTNESF